MKSFEFGATTRLLILLGRAHVESAAASANATRSQLIDETVKQIEDECGGALEEVLAPAPAPDPVPE